MTESDIKKLINSEISKFVSDSFDKEVKKVLHNGGSMSRDELIKTIGNAIELFSKTIWVKRDFWKGELR
jgi:hypothetical protein